MSTAGATATTTTPATSTAGGAAAGGGTPATTTTSAAMAAPAASPAATTVTTNDVNPGAWMAGFNDDMKGYVSNKGFKDAASAIDSYRNLEKLMGTPQERLMKLPEKYYDDGGSLTAEGRSVYERLGAPKSAQDYQLENLLPKEGGDKQLMEHFSKVFHDSGLPKSQAESIVKNWNEYQAKALEGFKAKQAEAFKNESAKLQTEWGAAFEQNRNIAATAMRTLGLSNEEVDAMGQSIGHFRTMQLLKNLGSSVGESNFIPGRQTGGGGPLEPSAARAKIEMLKKDTDFSARFAKGETSAISEWTNLHKQAHQGDMSV